MEGRSTDPKVEREKGVFKQEAIGSPSDSEPPPLEEESEPHSKASTPRISSSRLSEDLEKANSPVSYIEKAHSPASYTGGANSPSSFTGGANSPSSYTETAHSPLSYINESRSKGEEDNSTFAQNEPSPNHRINDNTHTTTSIGSKTTTVPIEKVDVKPSIRTSIPSITQSVAAAAKHVSFKSHSLSSRSSSAIYGAKSWWEGSTHQMKIVEVALRFGGAIFALITFAVMAATSEKRNGAGSTFRMKFSDYQAYNYLVAVNVISFVYSCWQTVMLVWQGSLPRGAHEKPLIKYACDQVLAFLLFSASTAAATASQLSRHGLHNIWPPACSTWSLWLFCSQADAAVALSFFSSFFVIASSVYSGYQFSYSA